MKGEIKKMEIFQLKLWCMIESSKIPAATFVLLHKPMGQETRYDVISGIPVFIKKTDEQHR